MDGNKADAAKAAVIIFREIRPILIGAAKNPKGILTAVDLVRGFLRPTELIRQTATGPVNDFTHCLKGARVDRAALEEFRRKFKAAFDRTGVSIPERWGIWRSLITQYNIQATRLFAQWADLISPLGDRCLKTPCELAVLTFAEASPIGQNIHSQGDLIRLRKSALWWKKCYPMHPGLFGQRHEDNFQKLTKQLRVESIHQTSYYKAWISLAERLCLPKGFENSLPNERMRLLVGFGADAASIKDFLRLGANVSAIRSANGSLMCVSSGTNYYASFSSLHGRPLIHPLERTVILWGSCFRPGRTFLNYTGHLKKACLQTGHSLGWYTPSVKEIAMGLKNAKNASFRLPNCPYTQDRYRIINKLGWIGEFSQIAFLSFLPSLRIPPDAFARAAPTTREVLKNSPISKTR